MKLLLLSIVFLASGCSTFAFRQPNSDKSQKILLTLDAHVHIESGTGYEGSLNNKFLGHSFLISSSYGINSQKDFPSRLLRDEEVSKIVSMYPLKFSGLCGVNLSWPDAVSVLSQCLKLPGMVGLKIHDLAETEDLGEEVKFKTLREIMHVMKSRDLVLLWHVRSDPTINKDKFEREIKEIVSSANRNRNINFILAHGVDSLDSTLHLQAVVDNVKLLNTRPENLFIELSATMDICEKEPQKEKVKLWENFGFDYILLGSDSSSRSWLGQAMLEEELSVIKSSSIPDIYKPRILINNGLKILNKVNPLAADDISQIKSFSSIDWNAIKTHTCESLRQRVQSLMHH